MKRLRTITLVGGTLAFFAASLSAAATLERGRLIRKSVSATSFSVELPIVTRIQGTAFFRTAVDINNNTSQNAVTAEFQYSYSCAPTSCGGSNFFRTATRSINLLGLESFHQDDFVLYLDQQGLLGPGAVQGSYGTLLVTFTFPQPLQTGSPVGWEGSAVARTYNHLDETVPSSATVGFSYNASLFFESAHNTLVGTGRDTKGSPTLSGKLRTNVGVRSTDINDTKQNLTVVLSFYDTVTGQKLPNILTLPDLQPGELRQISDLWTVAGIPSTTNQVIIFVDNPSGSAATPTFEGYVTIVDGGSATSGVTSGIATQDASFFEMKCGDATTCGR